MSSVTDPRVAVDQAATEVRLVDADVHTNLPSAAALAPYMEPRWRRHYETFGLRRPNPIGYFATRPRDFAARTDSVPPSGGPPGSDREFAVAQLLDGWQVDRAIINPITQLLLGSEPGEYGAVLERALNDWTLDQWLEPEPRFYGSLCVPCEDPDLAAAEIHRLGDHERFVQVLLNVPTREPIGSRRYWPMMEAAVEHDLPVSLHIGSVAENPVTGAGWPSSYFEFHCGVPTAVQAALVSLVLGGVFERLPRLKIVLQEGGFAWLPPLMWRLDRSWRRLHEEIPALQRPPSEYVREHVWVTTQPIEEPERPEFLGQVLDEMDMDEHIMFSSDYPHWDFDSPDRAIPKRLGEERRRKIYVDNALALYPAMRPRTAGQA